MRLGEATNWDQLLRACELARKRRLEKRRGFDYVWWMNIALRAGDHFVEWHPLRSEYIDPDPNPDSRYRMVINQAQVVYRTELAKLLKSRPMMEVVAASTSSRDINATKLSRNVLDGLEWKFRLRQLRKQWISWGLTTGTSAIFIGYDSDDDRDGEFEFLIDPNTSEPVFDPRRISQLNDLVDTGELDGLQKESWPLGDLEYKVFSSFQLLPDETKLNWNEIRNLITTEVVDYDEACGIWPAAKRLRPQSDAVLGTVEKRMMMQLGLMPSRDAVVQDALKIHTFWLLPRTYRANNFLKNGIMFRWSGDQILEKQPVFPFQDNRMPFVFFTHIPQDEVIWGKSILEDIRDANIELDRKVNQLIENADYMANPQWLVATQHQIIGKIKNAAGGMIRYVHAPGVPEPSRLEGASMPAQFERLPQLLREIILEISGQSETSRGRVPTGVRSGVAVAYLQEEDESKIAPTVEEVEIGAALMGSLSLSRISQFYTLKRTLRFRGDDGMWDVVEFMGADLKGVADVIPVAGSALPKSKAARQQYVLELVNLGVERDPYRIRQMLELGEGDPDDTDKARAQAKRENLMMLHGMHRPGDPNKEPMYGVQADQAQGPADAGVTQGPSGQDKQPMAPPVFQWHNHQVHVQVHRSLMMDEMFDQLQMTRPEIVRLFNEHIAMHEQVLQQQMQQEMQMQLALRGGPSPQGGGGGQPQAPMDMPDMADQAQAMGPDGVPV